MYLEVMSGGAVVHSGNKSEILKCLTSYTISLPQKDILNLISLTLSKNEKYGDFAGYIPDLCEGSSNLLTLAS